MASRSLWCGVLIVAVSFLICMPAEAQFSGGKPIGGFTTGDAIGIVVGAIAVAVIVTIVVVHESSKKRSITGCVSSGAGGMTLLDEKNQQTYALAGNTMAIKPGERMKLRGKKLKSKDAAKPLAWDTKEVAKDFGVCQP